MIPALSNLRSAKEFVKGNIDVSGISLLTFLSMHFYK